MRRFKVSAVISAICFVAAIIIQMINDRLFILSLFGLFHSLIIFIFSVIAIIVISKKKKRNADDYEIKEFQKKISIVIIALLTLINIWLCIVGGDHNDIVLHLILSVSFIVLAFLINMPLIMKIVKKRQDDEDALKLFEEMTGNKSEDDK